MKKNIIAFDLDGTLLDSAEAIIYSTIVTLRNWNLPILGSDYVKSTIGRPISEVFKLVTDNEELVGQLVQEFRENLASTGAERTRVFPGIKESLELLKENKWQIAVATNKNTKLAEKVISDMKLSNFFDLVVGQDLTKPKPLPDMLFFIRDELGENVRIMCGDTTDDIYCAKAAGARSIAISSGSQSIEKLKSASPDYFITDASQLTKILQEEAIL